MGRKAQIGIVVAVAVTLLGAAVAYAYDSSKSDTIAAGVTIAGVDVGGLNADRAKAKVRGKLVAPLRHSIRVGYGGQTWKLSHQRLKVRADLDGAVQKALAAGREESLPQRLIRYVSGGEVEKKIPARVEYSKRAVNRFVREVAGALAIEPKDATVEASGSRLKIVPAEHGRKLRDNLLTDQLNAAVLNAGADRTIAARTRSVAPEVTGKEVAGKYPTYLTLDRANFKLRFWRNLKLAKEYTVAVGQEGLETPEGLYSIQNKQVDPTWHVPNSEWAGDLAGEVIPPGPSNPLKARWMGIFEGAGIHGTDDTGSLGSAASHGCVRMSVEDVEDLYERVDVGTPIYIG